MDKKPSGFKARWKARYHHASIQLILSIAFTAVAVIGMLFLGSVQMFFIGMVGEYVLAINQRVMRRPLVIEEERLNWDSTEGKGQKADEV